MAEGPNPQSGSSSPGNSPDKENFLSLEGGVNRGLNFFDPSQPPTTARERVGYQLNGVAQASPLSAMNIAFCSADKSAIFERPVEQQRVQRIENILGHHRYVSVELKGDDGIRTVHITRPKDRPELLSVHVTTEATSPQGARYTSLEFRSFVTWPEGAAEETFAGMEAELDSILDSVDHFMAARASRPLMVNVSPQGYHERDKGGRLVLGLTDTGGQDKFIEDMAVESAALGFQVINVNRGGPVHPKHGEVREGMHYGADGVDLLYLDDGNPNFIPKEQMYDAFTTTETADYKESRVAKNGPCHELARVLHRQLSREAYPVAVIGHYADGGETVRLYCELLEAEGRELPRTVHIPHSTGLLKEERIKQEGKPVPESLNIRARERTERRVYESTDVLFSTSADMTESLVNGYGAQVHDTVLIGVQTDRFHPRDSWVPRNAPRYQQIWDEFSKITGRSVEALQNAQMVLEYSRTSLAKDKATTIRAFAESLKEADHDRILVLNIADPAEGGISPIDREYAESLRELVDELGLRGKVIYQHSFPNERCALLCQLADVYISSARLEPWGMAVQEAASSRLPIIASSAVAIASELLVGKNRRTIERDGEAVLTEGPGALMFTPGKYRDAAYAINLLLNKGGEERRASIAEGAYNSVIPSCTWNGILTRLWKEHLGMEFQDGKVVWPPRKPDASSDGIIFEGPPGPEFH